MKSNKEYVAERRRTLKSMIVDYMGGKCLRCGWNEHQAGLVPHHVDPAKKSFGLSADGCTRSWKRLQEECRKCVLLCHNCHSVIHATNDPVWSDESIIPDYGTREDPAGHNGRKMFYCVDCGEPCSFKAERCKSCAARRNATRPEKRKIVWPDKTAVTALVEGYGYRGTGRILGVSDNAVRKYLKT